MLARDIEMFIENCGLKGLSTKTINSYEQTLRLFMQYMVDITQNDLAEMYRKHSPLSKII